MAHEGTNLNNYNITKKFGTIKITQSATAIVVTANSKTKTYDGTELKEPGYTYDASLLAEGDTLQATVEGSVKDVGTAENKVMSVTVMRGTKDVTENYTFGTHIKGTLTVEKRTVVLESEGYE